MIAGFENLGGHWPDKLPRKNVAGSCSTRKGAAGTDGGLILPKNGNNMWVCLKIGSIPNEMAIFHRDNDQQNHWVQWGVPYFQTNPYIVTIFNDHYPY